MRILDLKVMRGPNFWSVSRHKLIVMKLDLEELEKKPTDSIEGFADRLEALMPGLYKHRCSEGKPGGFFFRVRKGTWMGHVIEHIALELQTLAGMECGYGRTRGTNQDGVYNVVFSYLLENAGLFAAHSAVRIAQALVDNINPDLEKDLEVLRKIRDREAFGPSTAAIVEEAESRGIPYLRLNRHSLVMLGHGVNQKRIQSTIACTTSNIAVDLACDKEGTKTILQKANIPVPTGMVIYHEDEVMEAVEKIGFPLVVKPVDGNHGRGITIKIQNMEDAYEAYRLASRVSDSVIVERFITGNDYRFLLVNYKLVAVARRTPACVKGTGKHTIQELVDIENQDERRGNGHMNYLTRISVDETTLNILKDLNLSLDSVLPENEILYLKHTANISTGGTASDVTDLVHPENVHLAERVARIIGLDICGIDVMAPCVSSPIRENGGAVLEVNAAPGLRMHLNPTEGLARNVAAPIVDMLFPKGTPATIPIVAVTGTNGKTTTTRLVSHLMQWVGHKVGFTTTDGIYIQNELVEKGDCTGPASAQFVLKDPTVDFAVLECARGGILRSGLGFRECDIAIVTNVADDHLHMDGIDTIEDMARVKAVVPETVAPGGYAILNADDDYAYMIRKWVDCKVALFSTSASNLRVKKHCEEGGLAAIIEDGFITICKGSWKTRIDDIAAMPLTYGGKAGFMMHNILPAVLTAYLKNVKIESIRDALRNFHPCPEQTKGRMNLFPFRNFDVLVDYCHNTHGFKAMAQFLGKVDRYKIGIIAGVGDRRDEDLINIGRVCSSIFDEIIIRQDKDLRGRKAEEIEALIREGINQMQYRPVEVIPDELQAVEHAIKKSREGTMVVLCTDSIDESISLIRKLMEQDKAGEMPGTHLSDLETSPHIKN